MRIESVTAHAFGPLNGQTLSFAEGMTVITGINEAGKSSWHAAVYAALCGRRRGRGRPNIEESRFIDLHRPWNGKKWAVSTVVCLDDGRRVELRQDLDGKVDCRATDVALSRDVSAGIINDGSPDGSRWLGLTRDTFRATACVGQAQLLAVLSAAGGLQHQLQQAAATAGADSTAADALAGLEEFRRNAVGRDITSSTRPLRRATVGLRNAESAVAEARQAHADYLRLVDAADAHRAATQEAAAVTASRAAAAAKARRDLAVGEATAREARAAADAATREAQASQEEAAREAQNAADTAARACADADAAHLEAERASAGVSRLRDRQARVQRLTTELGDRKQPETSQEKPADRVVAEALARYDARPDEPAITGPSSEELAATLATLPPPPQHDVTVHPDVRSAAALFQQAQAVLHNVEAQQPVRNCRPMPEEGRAAAVAPAVLRALAADLTAANADVMPERSGPAPEAEATVRRDRDMVRSELDESDAALRVARSSYEQASAERDQLPGPHLTPVDTTSRRRRNAALVLAVMLTLAVVLGLAGLVVVGAAVAVLALVAGGAALIRSPAPAPAVPDPRWAAVQQRLITIAGEVTSAQIRRDDTARRLTVVEGAVAAAEAAQQAYTERMQGAQGRQAALRARADQLGVPADPHQMHVLAANAEAELDRRRAEATWLTSQGAAEAAVLRTSSVLATALANRARSANRPQPLASHPEAVQQALSNYERTCEQAAAQARKVAHRNVLVAQLSSRRDLEASVVQARKLRAAASEALREGALAASLAAPTSGTDDHALAKSLRRWQRDRENELAALQRDTAAFAELRTLLDGFTPNQLSGRCEELTRAATALADKARQAQERAHALNGKAREAASRVTATRTSPSPLRDLDSRAQESAAAVLVLQRRCAEQASAAEHAAAAQLEATARAEHADGARAERARCLPDVAALEETLAAARIELDRVQTLDSTLETVQQFLTAAQDRVHRDIAPVIAGTLRSWLPTVTAGRYVDARVDPATLQVSIAGPDGDFRRADLLSHGTAEQVYLLLRAALAQHLTFGHDTCPLLLDDVTVQADSGRTADILNLLHKLSVDRQIVLFSQQDSVSYWANQHLTDGRDSLVTLEQLAVG